MPGKKNRMDFQIGFSTDQASVNAVKKSLQSIADIKPTQFKGLKTDLRQAQEQAQKVKVALERAFNPKLKTLNVSDFNQQLKISQTSIDQVYQSFSKLGTQGQVAFSQMASSILTSNRQLQQTKGILNSMGQTLFNTVKWGIASSIMNNFTGSIQQAFQYAKSLDGALTDIRIVTGDSTEQMKSFAQEANKAAQNLGRSTMDYTKAALTFYQQGLNDEEVKTRTETVLKAQNITGAGQEMADYLTAVWNGYKVANEEAELYVDKLAAVADSSASNMSQLAIAMSKVASSANLLGVPVDKLNAQIATITATTRQAPESVGNALKTIYSRINDIATGAQDAQVSLGNYSKQMLKVGISVLDSNGKLRDTGDVIDEIGAKWQTLSHQQQIFLARTMAGQRQYNNLLALFENWGKYTDLVNVSMEAQGTTMEKNSRYMESLGAKLQQLGTAGERVKKAFVDTDSFKGLVDLGTGVTKVFANLIESVGGGGNALLLLGGTLFSLFHEVIGREINNIIVNMQNVKANTKSLDEDIKNTQIFGKGQGYQQNTAIRAMVDAKREIAGFYGIMSNQQVNSYNNLVKEIGQTQNQLMLLKDRKRLAEEFNEVLKQTPSVLSGKNSVQEQIVVIRDQVDGLKESLAQFPQYNKLAQVFNNAPADKNFITDLIDQVAILETQFGEKAPKAFETFWETMNKVQHDGSATDAILNEVKNSLKDLVSELSLKSDAAGGIQAINNEFALAEARAKQATEAAKNYLNTIKQLDTTQSIVNTIGALGRLAGALNSVKNLQKTWENDSLSTGQKIFQTFSNGAMIIGVTATALRSVIKETKALSAAYLTQESIQKARNAAQTAHQAVIQTTQALEAKRNATKAARAALDKQQIINQGLNSKLQDTLNAKQKVQNALKEVEETKENKRMSDGAKRRANVLALKNAEIETDKKYLTTSQAKKILQERLNELDKQQNAIQGKRNAEGAKEVILRQAETDAALEEAAASQAAAKAKMQEKMAQEALNNSLKANPILLGITIAVAAITALTLVGVAIYKSYNAAAEAAQKARKEAQQAQKAYQKVKQTVSELNSGLSDLASAKQTFSSLTQGTQQWYQALDNVNGKVLELIQKFPELQQYLVSSADGVLGFTEEGQKQVQAIYRQRQMVSAVAYARASQKSAEAESDYAIVRQSRKIGGISSQQLTQVVNAINTHGSSILQSENTLKNALDKNSQLSKEQRDIIIKEADAINKLAAQVKNNIQAAQRLSQTLVQNSLVGNETFQNSQNKEVLSALVSQQIEKAGLNQSKYYTERFQVGTDIADALISSKGPRTLKLNKRGLAKAYEEYFNEEASVDFFGNFKINGTKVSEQYIKNQVATYEAMKQADEYIKQANEIISKWPKDITEIFSAFVGGITDVSKLSLEDLKKASSDESLKNAIAKQNNIDVTTEAGQEQINNLLNNLRNTIFENTNKYLASLGPSTEKAFRDNFEEEKLSAEMQHKIGDILHKAFVEGKGVQGLQQDVAKVLSDALKAGKLDELLSQDFSNLELDDFSNILKSLGIQTDVSEASLQRFIRAMKGISEVEQKTPQEIYKSVHDILDKKNGKTIKWGDQISAEQYDTLKEIVGENVTSAFKLMADGSYIFLGDAQEFYKKANQASLKPFEDKITQLKNKLEQLRNTPQIEVDRLKQTTYTEFKSDEYGGAEYVLQEDLKLGVLKDQINALNISNLISPEDFARYQEMLKIGAETGQYSKSIIDQINQKVVEGADKLGAYVEQEKKITEEQIKQTELQTALAQQDLGQLRNDFLQQGNEYGFTALGVQEYTQAVLNAAQAQGLEIENVKALAEKFSDQADNLQDVDDSLKDNINLSYELAAALEDIISGTQNLQKAWKDAIKDFKNGVQVSEAVKEETRQILSDMFNFQVDPKFVEDNLSTIADLVEGNLNAIGKLRAELGAAWLQAQALSMSQDLKIQIATQMNWDDFNTGLEELQNLIISNSEYLNNLQVGVNIEEAPFYDALNRFVQAAGLSAEQITELYGQIGYQPEITTRTIDAITDVRGNQQTGYWIETDMGNGQMFKSFITQQQYNDVRSGTAIQVPVIKPHSFRWSGGGRAASNYGGNRVAPKSSGSGGKGGKGGGSGKAKTPQTVKPQKESKPQKHVDERSDIYHDINLALEKQNKLLDDIQEKEEYLTKLERIDSLKEQNKQIEKQIDLLQEKADIAESQAIRLRNELVGDLGQAISFNADGTIANYNQALDFAIGQYNTAIDVYNEAVRKAEQEYNKYVDKYNAMSAEQQESNKQKLEEQKDAMEAAKQAAKDQLDVEKEKFDQIKENVKGYEDTLGIIDDMNDQIQDALRQIKENNLEGIKLQVELKLDTGEFERQYLDFEQKFVKKLDEDDFIGGTKALIKRITSYFDSEEINQLADKIKFVNDEIAKIAGGGQSDYFYGGLGQAQEVLQEYTSELMEKLGDIQDLVDEINQNYLTALDDAKDKMDQQIQQYERVGDLIEHNMKMVELMYGDKAYATMQKYYNQQRTNDQKQLQSLRNQQLFWQEQMSKEIVGTDAWQKAKQNVDDITDKLNSKLEDMVEKLADQFENRMNGIIENLNNSLSRGRGLDFIDQQWSDIENYDDKFLDVFNSRMGIDQVTRLYQDAIDGLSGSPANQQKLNKLMSDQLKMLKEKDHLTQYDLDRAKASLQVEKARMALEDSRYNKTKMRLRRDSQGNYTYQYVADEEKLSELQAALQDAQANLYNMDKQQYKQNLNDMYDAYKDYIQKMRTLTEKYNSTQDEAERARIAAQMDVVKEQYEQLWQGMAENSSVIFKNLRDSFTEGMGLDQTQYSAEQLTELMERLVPFVGSGLEDFTRVITSEGGLIPATAGAVQQLRQATIEYDEALNKTLADAGTSLETITEVTDAFGNALDNNILATQALITANEALIESCKAEVAEMKEMMQWLNSLLEGTYDLNQFVNQVREGYNTVQELNGSQVRADVIDVADNGLPKGENIFTGNAMQDAATLRQAMTQLIDEYEKYLQAMSIAQFDTGGMTGTWGDDSGRIAILHQKELVLNQDDTANILAVIRQYRAMTQRLNTAATGGIDAMAAAIAGQFGQLNSNSSFEQNVHIDAHFPNAVNHSEIEQAFNNLVNIASMRAARQGR